MSLIPPRSAWTVGLGTTLAFGNWGALPWIIGALVEGAGFRADTAAFLGTMELTLMGLSMLVMAPAVARLNRGLAICAAVPVAIGAQLASAYLHGYPLLLLVRAVSGIAFGLIFTVATAEGADAKEPERAFASATVIAMLFGIIKSPLLGYAKEMFGFRGVFVALAAYYTLVGVPLAILLLRAGNRKGSIVATSSSPLKRVALLPAAAVLIVMTCYSLATNGVYSFVERVASHVGISASGLGRGFAVSALIATLGGTAAARLGLRWGRALPTLGGLLVLGVLSLILMGAPSKVVFWGLYPLWAITYWFAYAYIMGLSVLVDPLGRLATATSCVLILAAAAGTGLAGVITERSGLASFGWVAGIICAIAAVAAVMALRGQPAAAVEPIPALAQKSPGA